MGEDYNTFLKRINAMQSGEIIDKTNDIDAMFFLKMACYYGGIETRMDLESEDGTPLGKKILILYKA